MEEYTSKFFSQNKNDCFPTKNQKVTTTNIQLSVLRNGYVIFPSIISCMQSTEIPLNQPNISSIELTDYMKLLAHDVIKHELSL